MIETGNITDMIGVVILNYNDVQTTIELVDKLVSYKSISNIVIVDNHSTDDSVQILNSKYKTITRIKIVISNTNGGYGAGNNIGIKYLYDMYGIRYQIICNPDVSFEENVVVALLQGIKILTKAAIVAPVMLDKNGK